MQDYIEQRCMRRTDPGKYLENSIEKAQTPRSLHFLHLQQITACQQAQAMDLPDLLVEEPNSRGTQHNSKVCSRVEILHWLYANFAF